MSKAPEYCYPCKGSGAEAGGNPCGFCDNGKPRDTQEDWDRSWGKLFEDLFAPDKRDVGRRESILDNLFKRKTDRKDDSTD